ncbi:MAG: hypothetical protein WBG50_21065 [Desulfomonilaceae bacterium]
MTPTRHNPKDQKRSPKGKQLSKGDAVMARILFISAAIVVLTASWVCAGNFEALANAGKGGPPTPLHIGFGKVVRTEFKADLNKDSRMELESDALFPEQASAREGARPKLQPAVAFRHRPSRGMAPASKASPKSDRLAARAEAKDENADMDSDLEKDLVISPPPAKTEEAPGAEGKPAVENKAGAEKKAVSSKKPAKKRARPTVKRMAPPRYGHYAASGKPIYKVHPTISQNPWSFPAGSYQNRPNQDPQYMTSDPRNAPNYRNRPSYGYAQRGPDYNNIDPRRAAMQRGADGRIVRDGVTIKLAPAAAPGPPQPYPPAEDESSESDLLSSATEIIGLPFAFISSFF